MAVSSIAALRERLRNLRSSGPVGLVPTMGALHDGHRRLIDEARRDCGTVVATIFVNPLQFDRAEDLIVYPRSLDADLAVCATAGVDLVFAPPEREMYPVPPLCTVTVKRLADRLCGAYRPGHFNGVATIVLKLLQIVQPDVAYFGEKDAQQLAIVRRLVQDLQVPVRVVGVPTVREADGLALSSRNRLLSPDERSAAPTLYAALSEAARLIASGHTEAGTITAAAARLVDPGARLEYLEIVDPDEMQPVAAITGPVRVAGAMWLGSTRLIDNLLCNPGPAPGRISP